MNRIDRVSAMLTQLQSKRVVKAQELADRFEISLRTVYRDIRTLEEAGVPLVGEAGIGYTLMEGYRLPPVMFTQEEALAFLTAEKLIAKLSDGATDQHFKAAMYKIKSVLKSGEKEFLEDLEERIQVVGNPKPDVVKPQEDVLQAILKSITEKRVINISYFARYNEQATERNVEPIGICFSANRWHLIAYCQLRNDYRDFRLDRISELSQTKQFFKLGQHPSLKDYLQEIAQSRELITIKILVEKWVVKHLLEQKYLYGFVNEEERGEQVEMTFLSSSIEIFARWLMIFGESTEIITPHTLQEKLNEFIEKLGAKHGIFRSGVNIEI
jgi:predicted DNA-binding transcriptional regulator YafY